MAPLGEILAVVMPEENKKSTEYLEKLFGKLQEMLLSNEGDLKQVILKKDAPRFHFSVNDKMYVEIKSGCELYLMKSKEPKEGKVYVFSPWHWNSGRIFLILEDYLTDLEPN